MAVVATSLAIPVASAPAAHADDIWDKVAECESGNDCEIDTGNSFYGGLQFTHDTWKAFGGHEFAPEANEASIAQQKLVAARTLEVQGPNAWPVCSKKAGLTRNNGEAEAPKVGRHRSEDKHGSDEVREQSGQPRHARLHVVRAGETLAEIAAANGTTWQEVYDDNRATISHPDRIFPGERIALDP